MSAAARERCWRRSFAPGPGSGARWSTSRGPSLGLLTSSADRVTTAGQSFFDPLPAGAHLYLLKSVLADWPDLEARDILRRCAEAARPAGRVVVLNGVSPDEVGAPPPDLLMMVLVGGRQRSLSEFRDLASEAGLEVEAAERQASGRFVVQCRPA